MEELYDLMMIISPIISLLQIAGITFTLLYMHFSAKSRNYTLGIAWYICGFFFSGLTLIVFLLKRKDFTSPETKMCVNCGITFPDTYNVCTNCGIELPQIDVEEKKKVKKLSKGFGIVVIIVYVISLFVGIGFGTALGITIYDDLDYFLGDELNYYDAADRIDVNGVYYDKKGNSYENAEDVLLYDEQGHVYTYVTEEKYNEAYEAYTYDEFYVRDDGQKYFAYDCYVTTDGWFYCDKAGLLELYTVDTSTMTEEELNEYYNTLLEDPISEYRYYDYPYMDADGNIYYVAYEASWNAQGQLITADNDVPLKQFEI
ncbi:MAG: hypothetical protein IKJ63_04830 [Clostridia bacterium]|nr:hypothetical protein [Clostridia bacterium]